MDARRWHMDATTGAGLGAMIRIMIGAILMWMIIAMIGHSIEAGRGNAN